MEGPRFDFARQAVLRLLDRLRPDDELSVFAFNNDMFDLSLRTTDRDEVRRAATSGR
jgi:hypothetical protein